MDIKDIIQEAKDNLYSESMVKELCDSSIVDYSRGVVQGRIEMLNWIEMKLDTDDEDEDSSL